MNYISNFDVFTFEWWSGAQDTIDKIKQYEKMDELQEYLEELFNGTTPTATSINDTLWFNSDEIYEALGIPI